MFVSHQSLHTGDSQELTYCTVSCLVTDKRRPPPWLCYTFSGLVSDGEAPGKTLSGARHFRVVSQAVTGRLSTNLSDGQMFTAKHRTFTVVA